ncbi:MAG: helix-turn-helix domain-containing protein [Opitutales bacterium]
MNLVLSRIGYYISPVGGAPLCRHIPEGQLYLECITAGRVFGPEEPTEHGPGWIFAHGGGQATVHRSPLESHYECMTVAFEGEAPAHWPRAFRWDDESQAVEFCREMLYAFHYSGVDREILGDLILAQLGFRLARHLREESRRDIPPRIAALLSMIDREYARELPVSELAVRAGWSESYLHGRFKQVVGATPHQYILQQRMRAARHRLVTTHDPIKAIAIDLGYANPESFCRAFKQSTGRTAAAFRRRHQLHA